MKADRIASLERKHSNLHKRVEALETERAPDIYINPLKAEKLKIKDEIAWLSKQVESNEK